MENLVLIILLTPGVIFLGLSFLWLCGWTIRERPVASLTAGAYAFTFMVSVTLAVRMFLSDVKSIELSFGNWFTLHEYTFPLVIAVDELSLPLMILTIVLVGIVGVFSSRYLHREKGFQRFFLLLHLFAFGSLLIFSAGSLEMLVGGWELVGITSVLLIAFFHQRPDPVRCAMRVFVTYRGCDIGLLVAVFVLHHSIGTAVFSGLFSGNWPDQTFMGSGGVALTGGLLLLAAASGKSAQFPFSSWLPRAMEGPTPSSAIFYGAISVHAGAYLLLRFQPLIAASDIASIAVITVGLITALSATVIGRACTDIKTSLSYAVMTQVGLIFIEIGAGWKMLALIHIISHATLRTLQFLRAPSILRDFYETWNAVGGEMAPTGVHYEKIFPISVQNWLYRFALERGHQDALLDLYLIGPVSRLSAWLNRHEYHLTPSRMQSFTPAQVPPIMMEERTPDAAGRRIDG